MLCAYQKRRQSREPLLWNLIQHVPAPCLDGRPRLYVPVVASHAEADLAILRLDTAGAPVDTPNRFPQSFHHGDLDFKGEARAEILSLLRSVPTIVVINLDRPAVIPRSALPLRFGPGY